MNEPDGKFEVGVQEMFGNLDNLLPHKLGVLDVLVVIIDVIVDNNQRPVRVFEAHVAFGAPSNQRNCVLPRENREWMTWDQITIKTPNPKCRLYWCSVEFIEWSRGRFKPKHRPKCRHLVETVKRS